MEKDIPIKIYEVIESELKRKKIKKYMLAEEIGMKSNTLSDQLKKLKNGNFPPIDTLQKIQNALKVDIIKFF